MYPRDRLPLTEDPDPHQHISSPFHPLIHHVLIINAARSRFQNIVGYANTSLRSGSYMTGATFNLITGEGMKLMDLVPQGYVGLKYYEAEKRGGFNGLITVTVLTAGAGVAKDNDGKNRQWRWNHEWTETDGWAASGKWVRTGDNVEITDANNPTFDVGEGLWIEVNSGVYSSTKGKAAADAIKIMNSGAALTDARVVTLRSGSKGVIAPISKSVKLTEIIPEGYIGLPYYEAEKRGGFNGLITVTVLTAGAGVAKEGDKNRQWRWNHEWTEGNGWAASGKWVRTGDNVEITSENDVTFNVGEGLWIEVNSGVYSSTKGKAAANAIKVGFPGLED